MTNPLNPHLSDPTLHPFLTPTFSAVDYLNSTLPSLAGGPANTTTSTTKAPAPTLSALASQTQSHISTLTAQQSRLASTLTDLTDEILRTSSRLAYEVELLRGEAVSLADALSSKGVLGAAIETVVPGGIAAVGTASSGRQEGRSNGDDDAATKTADEGASAAAAAAAAAAANEPAALPKLRTLHRVRNQLQAVIRTFNVALGFPMPPSLLTTTASSIVSLSSPNADPDAEKKGQAALGKLKGEVVDLLRAGDVEGARRRVEELRQVCVVWKGTGEEKARGRWVDGLEQLIEAKEGEERERRELKGGRKQGRREESVGGRGGRQTPMNEKSAKETGTGGAGFLRRLRDEIYLD